MSSDLTGVIVSSMTKQVRLVRQYGWHNAVHMDIHQGLSLADNYGYAECTNTDEGVCHLHAFQLAARITEQHVKSYGIMHTKYI